MPEETEGHVHSPCKSNHSLATFVTPLQLSNVDSAKVAC